MFYGIDDSPYITLDEMLNSDIYIHSSEPIHINKLRCPICEAEVRVVVGKYNKPFYGCIRYPECKGTLP